MIRFIVTFTALICASFVSAGDLEIQDAYVPLAPPGAMSHAAYLTLENNSDEMRSLIGIKAEGYGMAHMHKSEKVDGVATMSMLHQLDIAPGQTVKLIPGGLHIMLMRPEGTLAVGDTVALTLTLANGEELPVVATIEARGYGS